MSLLFDFVFTHKRELPKYSCLVDKSEIIEKSATITSISVVTWTTRPSPRN